VTSRYGSLISSFLDRICGHDDHQLRCVIGFNDDLPRVPAMSRADDPTPRDNVPPEILRTRKHTPEIELREPTIAHAL